MATSALIGALRVTLGLDSAAFEKGAKKADGTASAFGKRMSKLGGQMQKTGAVMSTAVTAPLVAMGGVAAKSFSDFEASMSNVSTLIDTSTESLKDVGAEVLGISKRVPVALGDMTSALYDVRSAGIGAGDAMKVLEGSARLGVAGLGSTKQAVDLVTSSINAFGLEGEKAEKVYDNIFKTVKNGKTDISQLAQGFGAVAGTVANAGVELDEYLAAVAAMTTTGLPAAQAHTQIRAAIVGLTRDTKESAAVFEKLGVKTFKDLIEKAGGMVPAFQQIGESLNWNDAQMIKLLGSSEAYAAVLATAQGQNAAFTATLDDMRNGADAVGEAFDKQAETSAAKAQLMKNKLGAAAIQIGEVVVPVVVKLAEIVGRMAEAFSALDPEARKVIITLAAIAAAAGPVLFGIGSLIKILVVLGPAIAGIVSVGGTLIGFLGTLGPALLTVGRIITGMLVASGPIGWLALALAAIVTVWQNWDKIGPIVTALYNTVKTWIQDKLGAVWEFTKQAVTAYFQLYTTLPQLAIDAVKALYEGVKTWLMDKLGAVLDWVGKKVKAVTGVFKDMYVAVVGNSYVPDMVDGIAAEFGRLDSVMVQPAQDAAASVGDAFAEQADRVGQALGDMLAEGKVTLRGLVDLAGSVADDLFVRPFLSGLSQQGGGGGFLSSLLGGLSRSFAGGFAGGGVIPRGQWGIVGEDGPELAFAGRGAMSVLPSGGGGGVTQIFNISTPDANSFRASERQIARAGRQRLAPT